MEPKQHSRNRVFISYSHKDKDWLERLRTHLKPLERQLPQLEIWDDTKIKAGSKWRPEIEASIAQTKVAVLLVSADFLASDFVANDELPPLLEAAERDGARVLPLIVSPSRFLRIPSLAQFQTVNDPGRPLLQMEPGEREAVFVKVTDTIEDLLAEQLWAVSTIVPSSASSARKERKPSRVEATTHTELLEKGVPEWNRWRKYNHDVQPNLSGLRLTDADLSGANLASVDLSGAMLDGSKLDHANLREARLDGATLIEADLTETDLSRASLHGANLSGATLERAHLVECDLRSALLRRADLSEAHLAGSNLSSADLQRATLVKTDLVGSNLSDCRIHGISAWDLRLESTLQRDLVITLPDEPTITVDNIEVAQVIYLFLYNEKVRDVLNAVSAKNVLILGRFTQERQSVLHSIREALRRLNYIPVLFDFGAPTGRNITETLMTLAAMARFIVADITDARAIAQELYAITSSVSIPIKPIIEESSTPFAMFADLARYPWVLPISEYDSTKDLRGFLTEQIVTPAEAKVNELAAQKRRLAGA